MASLSMDEPPESDQLQLVGGDRCGAALALRALRHIQRRPIGAEAGAIRKGLYGLAMELSEVLEVVLRSFAKCDRHSPRGRHGSLLRQTAAGCPRFWDRTKNAIQLTKELFFRLRFLKGLWFLVDSYVCCSSDCRHGVMVSPLPLFFMYIISLTLRL